MARYLHCGDFRACPAQATHKAIQNACPLDAIYLDTTYLNPQYCFPPQPQVIKACADLVTSKTSPLVVVGTYSIGKERLFLALAEALDTYIYCVDKRKYHTYALLDDTTLQKRLTKDPLLARVHVMPLRALVPNALQTYADALQKQGLTIAQTLAFRPTGWTSRQTRQQAPPPKALTPQHIVPPPFTQRHLQPTRHGSVQMYAVPYSEHSSFYELMAFLLPRTTPPHDTHRAHQVSALRGRVDGGIPASGACTDQGSFDRLLVIIRKALPCPCGPARQHTAPAPA